MFSTILAIESSSDRATVAVRQTGSQPETYHERFSVEGNRHAENLLPLITQLLSSLQLSQRDVNAVAVGVGPGSFTGLRAGIALAVGLGLGLDVPVFGVSSLTALACGLATSDATRNATTPPELVGALLDARRGEYFFAAFTRDLTPVVAPCLLSANTLTADIERAAGQRSIWVAGQAAVERLGATQLAPPDVYLAPEISFPSAQAVARLVGTVHATPDPLPQYLRDPDVKVPQLPPNPLVSVD